MYTYLYYVCVLFCDVVVVGYVCLLMMLLLLLLITISKHHFKMNLLLSEF